jgi:hypothetical protein
VDSAWEQIKLETSLSPALLNCAGCADRPGKDACKPRTLQMQQSLAFSELSRSVTVLGVFEPTETLAKKDRANLRRGILRQR